MLLDICFPVTIKGLMGAMLTGRTPTVDPHFNRYTAKQLFTMLYVISLLILFLFKIGLLHVGIYLSIYLPIRLNHRRGHQTGSGEPSAGGKLSFFVCVSFCAMLVVLEVSACLIMLNAKQGSHWYHF